MRLGLPFTSNVTWASISYGLSREAEQWSLGLANQWASVFVSISVAGSKVTSGLFPAPPGALNDHWYAMGVPPVTSMRKSPLVPSSDLCGPDKSKSGLQDLGVGEGG